MQLDLADLSSVRRAAAEIAELGPLDVLVNNAGVMGTPYHRTADGLELQMATNHFGPFLLTGLLLPQLTASGAARVVTVSSQMHRTARKAPLGDPLVQQGRYQRWPTYGETKLANLLFTYELDRRARRAELPVKALAAHPGFASTHLVANGQFGRSTGGRASILDAAIKAFSPNRADAGRLADADGGDRRPPGRDVLRTERDRGVERVAPGRHEQQAVVRRDRPAPAVAAQRRGHRRQLPLTEVLVRHSTIDRWQARRDRKHGGMSEPRSGG